MSSGVAEGEEDVEREEGRKRRGLGRCEVGMRGGVRLLQSSAGSGAGSAAPRAHRASTKVSPHSPRQAEAEPQGGEIGWDL